MQKAPRRSLETEAASPHETTGKARAPRRGISVVRLGVSSRLRARIPRGCAWILVFVRAGSSTPLRHRLRGGRPRRGGRIQHAGLQPAQAPPQVHARPNHHPALPQPRAALRRKCSSLRVASDLSAQGTLTRRRRPRGHVGGASCAQ